MGRAWVSAAGVGTGHSVCAGGFVGLGGPRPEGRARIWEDGAAKRVRAHARGGDRSATAHQPARDRSAGPRPPPAACRCACGSGRTPIRGVRAQPRNPRLRAGARGQSPPPTARPAETPGEAAACASIPRPRHTAASLRSAGGGDGPAVIHTFTRTTHSLAGGPTHKIRAAFEARNQPLGVELPKCKRAACPPTIIRRRDGGTQRSSLRALLRARRPAGRSPGLVQCYK